MKKSILFLFLAPFGFLKAQTCGSFYLFKPGSQVETTMYNKKGSQDGKTLCVVSKVEPIAGGQKSSFTNTFFSESGKKQNEVQGSASCQGGKILIDMKNFVNEDQMKAFKDMEVKSAEAYLEYPETITVGSVLPDGKFHMDITNQGSDFGSVDVSITQRKVVGQEDVSSTAGTWKCFKITYSSVVKTKVMGMGFPIEMNITEWYAPGFGIVKTETFGSGGKMLGSSLVTSVK
jgi:hypothetical protein